MPQRSQQARNWLAALQDLLACGAPVRSNVLTMPKLTVEQYVILLFAYRPLLQMTCLIALLINSLMNS